MIAYCTYMYDMTPSLLCSFRLYHFAQNAHKMEAALPSWNLVFSHQLLFALVKKYIGEILGYYVLLKKNR